MRVCVCSFSWLGQLEEEHSIPRDAAMTSVITHLSLCRWGVPRRSVAFSAMGGFGGAGVGYEECVPEQGGYSNPALSKGNQSEKRGGKVLSGGH